MVRILVEIGLSVRVLLRNWFDRFFFFWFLSFLHIVIDFFPEIRSFRLQARSDANRSRTSRNRLFLTPQTAIESVDRFLFGDLNLFNIFEFIF